MFLLDKYPFFGPLVFFFNVSRYLVSKTDLSAYSHLPPLVLPLHYMTLFTIYFDVARNKVPSYFSQSPFFLNLKLPPRSLRKLKPCYCSAEHGCCR